MTTEEFIAANASADVATLALRGAPQGVDMPFALRQIEGRQTALRKLPRWAAIPGIIYPVRLSMQQCSSQETAEYKARIVRTLRSGDGLVAQSTRSGDSPVAKSTRPGDGLVAETANETSLLDLTGGLGVDFSFLAPLFDHATYVERDAALCELARHNLPLLGLPHAHIINGEATASSPKTPGAATVLSPTPPGSATSSSPIKAKAPYTLIYLDPARRDGAGRKVVRIEDCTPNLAELLPRLLQAAPWVMAKLSPMLDISQALRSLSHVAQVHIVGADGECKELLMLMHRDHEGEPEMHCHPLRFTRSDELNATPTHSAEVLEWLYEPSPAMMKAAPFRLISQHYGVAMLHPDSHLYTSARRIDGFPGRTFHVVDVCDVKSFRRQHPDIKAAGITVRHYPDTPEALRRRLKLKEGGDNQIVATTLPDGRHVLILGRRSVLASS